MGRLIKQKGYLLITAVIILVVFAAVGAILARSYMRKGEAVAQGSQSKQALFIAKSALAMAHRSLVEKALTCATINGDSNFTAASLLGGQMTVTGSAADTTTTLASAITASSTSLTLSNASTFGTQGVVDIDNELIGYHSKSGNVLSDLVRGLKNTSAIAHSASAIVKQDQCLLTSKAAFPSFTAPTGQHTLHEVLIKKLFNFEFGTPSLLSASEITLRGNSTITNTGVVLNSDEYPGSTIISGANINIQGSAETQVGDGSGGTVVSSTAGSPQADLMANVSALTSANLYSYYFGAPLTTISSIADHSYDETNIDGVSGKVIWINGDFKITGSSTYDIGTPADPVILIIDGDLDIKGSPTINFNGLLYVTGEIDITGNADIIGNATIAAEGSETIDPEVDVGGSMHIDLNPTNLGALSNLTPYVNYNYVGTSFLMRKSHI
jgi:Tfp pilus assembly protein PilX